MTTISLTEFRSNASEMLDRVERGETIVVLRHGRPIAEVVPVSKPESREASWKKPGLKLTVKGASLSAAILEERNP